MKAPKLPSFLKQNTYKRYEGTYRFYDPEKEKLEKLKRKYQIEDDNLVPSGGIRRGDMRKMHEQNSLSKGKSSNRTLIIIILVLVLACILLLRSSFFERVLNTFLR